MNYERMWEALKEELDDALVEGRECCYDTQFETEEYGMFYTYERISRMMKRLEYEDAKSNSNI